MSGQVNNVVDGRERRREPRATRLGRASLRVNSQWVRDYEIANLSASGALLIGGPRLRSRRRLQMLLSLRGMPAMVIEASVVRFDENLGTLAVQFEGLDPSVEDLLHDVVLASLSGRRPVADRFDIGAHLLPIPKGDEVFSEFYG